MTQDSFEFLSVLRSHQEKSGINKKTIAGSLKYDASLITRIFQGERKPTAEFLQGFCNLLKLTLVEKVALFTLAGMEPLIIDEKTTLFDKNMAIYEGKSLIQIARNLNEWKQIHTTTQALLLSTEIYIKAVSRMSITPIEQTLFDVSEVWFIYCEPKARKLRETLKNSGINHLSLEDLTHLLGGENSIVEHINFADLNIPVSVKRLKMRTFELKDSLIEVLDLADLHIIKIADSLTTAL